MGSSRTRTACKSIACHEPGTNAHTVGEMMPTRRIHNTVTLLDVMRVWLIGEDIRNESEEQAEISLFCANNMKNSRGPRERHLSVCLHIERARPVASSEINPAVRSRPSFHLSNDEKVVSSVFSSTSMHRTRCAAPPHERNHGDDGVNNCST